MLDKGNSGGRFSLSFPPKLTSSITPKIHTFSPHFQKDEKLVSTRLPKLVAYWYSCYQKGGESADDFRAAGLSYTFIVERHPVAVISS